MAKLGLYLFYLILPVYSDFVGQTREVPAFSRLDVEGPIKVFIEARKTPHRILVQYSDLTHDDKVLAKLETIVLDGDSLGSGTLKIRAKDGETLPEDSWLVVNLEVDKLTHITTGGACEVRVIESTIAVPKISLTSRGTSSQRINLNCDDISARAEDRSTITIGGLNDGVVSSSVAGNGEVISKMISIRELSTKGTTIV